MNDKRRRQEEKFCMIGRQPKKKSRNQFRKVEEAHFIYVLRFFPDAFLVITQGVETNSFFSTL